MIHSKTKREIGTEHLPEEDLKPYICKICGTKFLGKSDNPEESHGDVLCPTCGALENESNIEETD